MTTANTEKPVIECIAVDDEPLALHLLSDDIGRIPFLQLAGTFRSAAEAGEFLKTHPVDLMFLDIQMPGLSGIQFLREAIDPPLVIFMTAFEQYALEGFELGVVDYLLKPVPFDRFQKAVSKAHEQVVLRKGALASAGDFFFVRADYKEIKIFFEDVLYVEGLKDYVKIFTSTATAPILTRLNLKAIEAKLPPNLFCRVHHSFIVPFRKITSTQRSQLFVGKKLIPIGEKYAEDFRKRYGNHR